MLKIPQSHPFGKGFLEKYFCSFENSLLGYSRSLFQKETLEANANFCVFESQCPKIMVLSKTLKAKLLSIPNRVTSLSLLGLDRLSGKTAYAVPSFDHHPW